MRHQPSSLFYTALSSSSSSLLLPWLVPPHPSVAHTSLAGTQNEFLCGLSQRVCCCPSLAVRHRLLRDADSPGGPRSPHAVDSLPPVCSESALLLDLCQILTKEIWASCCRLVAGLRNAKTSITFPQEVRYIVNRCYVHEWKCIPVDGLMWEIWHRALKGVIPSSSQDWLESLSKRVFKLTFVQWIMSTAQI